ncbi:MAG TPA: SDR family NAD(P)-dependent oxidoreductase [Steroidobacteraceae bacterium]|jgi:NAD(P)-dependent dehydrogenase (short-subunit alcohol dehydrogenase family)
MNFEGQLVLVTGGTGALGSAVARAFLEAGAQVAVTYRSRHEYDDLQDAASAHRTKLRGHEVDVTDEAAMLRLVGALEAEFPRLLGLVNAVGGFAGGTKLWEMESAVLERMLALNLRSAFVSARSVLPVLLRQHSGCIVNIAARSALEAPGGAGAYVASKAAAIALMHSLAMDLQGTGVRVNSVLPNIIDTAANRRDMPHANFAAWTKPEEIARVILVLCTADTQAINGAAIPV